MPQTVWIVEPCGYDEYGICGVYASLEAAKASLPDRQWELVEDSPLPGWFCIPHHAYRIYEEEVRG